MTTSSTGLRSFYAPSPTPEPTPVEETPPAEELHLIKEIPAEEVVIPIINDAETEHAEDQAKTIGKWGWTILLVGVISAVITAFLKLFF